MYGKHRFTRNHPFLRFLIDLSPKRTETTVLLERVTSRIPMFPNWPVADTGILFQFNELSNILYVGPDLKAIAIIEL